MNIFRRIKLRNQQVEGLFLIHDGLKLQLEQAAWNLERTDLSEVQREYWHARKCFAEYWENETQDALNGKLHF